MRQFVLVGHEAPTTPEFSLSDLAGGAGRLDVLCRCVNSAFFLSHDLRESVRVHLVLGDEFTVTFEGSDLRRLNPDERSTAALVRGALEEREGAVGAMGVESSPGVTITRRGFDSLVGDLSREADGPVVQLHEDGEPVSDVAPPADPVFVLSDHRDFTGDEAALLDDVADRRVRLGPRALHADHAITVAHHWLDTDCYRSF
ncbi:tRNA (pseudouridine(54)-N(1))-methyltransferase TrmY [Halobacteriales archaeon QS_8_69_26]|nr:MAG: tRNA (pseudouridine(54)-N(1))-methyltransferase TrmY [Halobacteriales archaeon QS_8_69_26]